MRYSVFVSIVSLIALISIITLRSVAPHFATAQFIFFLIGFTAMIVISRVSYYHITQFRWFFYLGLCLLLLVTLLIGNLTRGSTRWIEVGNLFSIQGSQLAVPLVGLVVAEYIAHHDLNNWKHLLFLGSLLALPGALIFIEPDLGTTLVYILSLGSLIFFSGFPWKYIFGLAILGVIAAIVAWLFLLQPYQKERFTNFLNASQDPKAAHYNAQQSLIAVGSGSLWGRGLGQGVQSHLRFLPERQTDFIFASLAEEWGFLGSSILLLLYSSLLIFILRTAWYAPNASQYYYCMLTVVFIALQSGINIGMNMGLLPITGITLPLISYGGSSVVSLLIQLGIVLSILEHQKTTALHHLR